MIERCGGANGSIRFEPEINHGANAGLVNALQLLQPIKDQYPEVGWADLIQLASAAAIEQAGERKITGLAYDRSSDVRTAKQDRRVTRKMFLMVTKQLLTCGAEHEIGGRRELEKRVPKTKWYGSPYKLVTDFVEMTGGMGSTCFDLVMKTKGGLHGVTLPYS